MTRVLGVRFWIEALLASVSGFLFALTLVSRDWIEATTGYDPDRHSGSAEWAIIGLLFAATVVFGRLARTQWERSTNQRPAARMSTS